MVSHTLAVKDFRPKVIHITIAHIIKAIASNVKTPNLKEEEQCDHILCLEEGGLDIMEKSIKNHSDS